MEEEDRQAGRQAGTQTAGEPASQSVNQTDGWTDPVVVAVKSVYSHDGRCDFHDIKIEP